MTKTIKLEELDGGIYVRCLHEFNGIRKTEWLKIDDILDFSDEVVIHKIVSVSKTIYGWTGGDKPPVPDGVEVEVECGMVDFVNRSYKFIRGQIKTTESTDINWKTVTSFRLTERIADGYVLEGVE